MLTAIVPAMAVMGGIMGKFMAAASKGEMDTYGKAGAIAEQVTTYFWLFVVFNKENERFHKIHI